MDDEEKMAWTDYDGLKDAEVYTLPMLGDYPISKTRIQRIMLLANAKFGLGLQFSEGACDDIDEALEYFRSTGICGSDRIGFALSGYGMKVKAIAEAQEAEISGGINRIRDAFKNTLDKDLVVITSHFYPEARIEAIQNSVNACISIATIDGIPLSEYPKELFEENLGEKPLVYGENKMNGKTKKKESDNNQLCCICREKNRRIKACNGDSKTTPCGSSEVPHKCPGFVPGNIGRGSE